MKPNTSLFASKGYISRASPCLNHGAGNNFRSLSAPMSLGFLRTGAFLFQGFMQIVEVQPRLKSSSRNGKAITTIVIHSTAGGSAASSIAYLRKPSTQASYHYIIERDGVIYKCVDVGKKAWHAGVSVGPQGSDVNPYSVGIAFANRNNGVEPVTAKQLAACRELVDALLVAIPTVKWVTTHYGISYPRKTDARLFDLKAFVAGLVTAVKPTPWVKPGVPWTT